MYKHYYPPGNIFVETVFLLFREIGIGLFIFGSITVFLELSDYTKYFLDRLTAILINDAFLVSTA